MKQASFFDNVDESAARAESLPLDGGELAIYRAWLNESTATHYFNALFSSIRWEQPIVKVYGKYHPIPRKQAWYGDPGAVMLYSGRAFEPLAWISPLLELKQKLESDVSTAFNSVLTNLYRDGNDKVGWHADDEPELGLQPTIASLSLGATRKFCLKPKPQSFQANNPSKRIDIFLAHGDLLVMRGATQNNWLHTVPTETRVTTPRINLTFRNIMLAAQ